MAVSTGTALLASAAATAGTGALDYKSGQDAQERALRQREESRRFIQENIDKARGDLFKLFPSAQQDRRQGIEAGLDLYQQSIPAQQQAFQQGNMQAQNVISQGLPQANNAILGGPVGYSAFQPQQINAGLQIPQQAPQTEPIEDVVGPQAQQNQGSGGAPSPFQFSVPTSRR